MAFTSCCCAEIAPEGDGKTDAMPLIVRKIEHEISSGLPQESNLILTKQFPSTVEVPTVQPTQLPNLPGNGGITVTNDDPQFSADLSNYQAFPRQSDPNARAAPEHDLWGRRAGVGSRHAWPGWEPDER